MTGVLAYAAFTGEYEILRAQGVDDIELIKVRSFHPDTVVIQYRCTPTPCKVLRLGNVNTPGKTRYYEDMRIAIYVRDRRAASVLVKRNYFDIADAPAKIG